MNLRGVLRGVGLGVAYGVLLRLLIGWADAYEILGVMSIAFVLLGPLAIGYLTVRFHPAPGWWYRLFAPWAAVVVGTLIVAIKGEEGGACIIMGLPVMLPMSTLGGLLAHWPRRPAPAAVAAFALLPLVGGGFEGRVPEPVSLRTVESVIEISAPPSRVWQEIVQVPTIVPTELPDALYLRMGLPRPISATIDGYGVGAMRRATFTGALTFHEKVTDWVEPRLLSFRIAAQTDSIPPTTLDRHVTIGGEYFDVLQGTYVLEPYEGGTRLRLTSKLRVSTHFNAYSGPWADAIMKSIQETILAVEKKRAES